MTFNDLRKSCKYANKIKRESYMSDFKCVNILNNKGDEQIMSNSSCKHRDGDCPQLPGTILRVFIPTGAVINLLNLIELSAPSGVCLILRSPLLGGCNLSGISNSLRQIGGSVELVN